MLTRLRSMSEGKSKIQPVNTDSDGMEVTQEIGELCVGQSEPNEEHNATAVIKEEELEQFDYSPTVVKFKVLDMMKKMGIRGKRNGNAAGR